jgi:hypothetical protein
MIGQNMSLSTSGCNVILFPVFTISLVVVGTVMFTALSHPGNERWSHPSPLCQNATRRQCSAVSCLWRCLDWRQVFQPIATPSSRAWLISVGGRALSL